MTRIGRSGVWRQAFNVCYPCATDFLGAIMTSASNTPHAIVVGGGPAGLAAALALAATGLTTRLAAGPHRPGGHDRDRRTAALFAGSIELLRNLGVWDACAPHCAPLKAIRLVDDTGRFLKAPEVTFHASEAGLEAFGYNVPNGILLDALMARAAAAEGLTLLTTQGARSIIAGRDQVSVTLAEGQTMSAPLVVAADGRTSPTREAAGITVTTWSYPQTAVVTWFTHQRDHDGVSTEFHRPVGPFTTVPMPGRASSLVWVEEPGEAQRLVALGEAEFRRAIETRLAGLLGSVGEIGPRAAFPLSGLTPDVFGRNRVALVGESGHVIPPIGAQGLNLGLRDAATLADCAGEALAAGRDPGGRGVMEHYSALRSPDVTGRITTVDILNRTLLSPYLPVHLLRGLGLHVLNSVGPLRRKLVQEGVQPSGHVPVLMRRGGLAMLPANPATAGLAKAPA
jgi:2-octaprenyl-6-methoxyphenol hydroxylase